MAEIISFPQRMHFTAVRTYDAAAGVGGVVAVLFAPANLAHIGRGAHAVSAGQMSGRITPFTPARAGEQAPIGYANTHNLNDMSTDGVVLRKRGEFFTVPVYAARPAQAVDLWQFRAQVADLLRSEFRLEIADPEDHRHDDGSGEAGRIAGKIVALLDSLAVGK